VIGHGFLSGFEREELGCQMLCQAIVSGGSRQSRHRAALGERGLFSRGKIAPKRT
jgi:hypothetical protein